MVSYKTVNCYLSIFLRMVSCLIQEWETLREQYTLPPPVTIFFGGGTPSLLETKYVEMLTSRIAASSRSCLEVSLEANPGDLIGKVESLKNAGVTRLSIGAQALNDRDLKFLNRNHNVVQIWKSLEESHKVFPRSTSADLIFGRPWQSSDNFLSELRQLSSAGLAHVSLYQLTVERGTRLHRQVASGRVQLPGEEEMADMYSGALATLAAAGLARYEVSNFSVAGAECLHNLGYWSGRQYLGLGPGAHSRVGRGQQRWVLYKGINEPSTYHHCCMQSGAGDHPAP